MDLFQEVIEKSEMQGNSSQLTVTKKTASFDNRYMKLQMNTFLMFTKIHFVYRSDTDSGHSSAQGDRDIYAIYNKESHRNTKVADKKILKVSRITNTDEHRPLDCDIPFNKFNPIGYAVQMEMEEKPLEPSKRLQVTRRRDEILKRRNRSRRNTIAVNLLDIEKGNRCQSNASWDGSSSKSTNCIDKIGRIDENGFVKKVNEFQMNGSSMPGAVSYSRFICVNFSN